MNNAWSCQILTPSTPSKSAAADLEGVDGVRIWQDQALFKLRYAQQTYWHQDNPIWSFDSKHAITIWIAFDDATINNGCLFFIPGLE